MTAAIFATLNCKSYSLSQEFSRSFFSPEFRHDFVVAPRDSVVNLSHGQDWCQLLFIYNIILMVCDLPCSLHVRLTVQNMLSLFPSRGDHVIHVTTHVLRTVPTSNINEITFMDLFIMDLFHLFFVKLMVQDLTIFVSTW